MAGLEARTNGDKARAYLARVLAWPDVAAFLSGTRSPVWSNGIEVVADPPQKWGQTTASIGCAKAC